MHDDGAGFASLEQLEDLESFPSLLLLSPAAIDLLPRGLHR
jgi:hypothetical protein